MESLSGNKPGRPVWLFLAAGAVVMVVLVVFGVVMSRDRQEKRVDEEPTPAAIVVTPSPQPSLTPTPTCAGGEVSARLEAILGALAPERNDMSLAQAELDAALSAYAGLIDQPVCGALAQELLGIQALVAASAAWEAALESASVRQVEKAAQLAARAVRLAPAGPAESLAAGLAAAIEGQRALLVDALAPDRIITRPETITTELAGGLHPLCEVNTMIKPLLAEQSGAFVPFVGRITVYSDTLFVLAGGQLMTANLERVHGPAPAVFLQPADPKGVVVAGARVEELVDLTFLPPSPSGGGRDLLLLEKSGRVLRRTLDGEWSLERPAQLDEMPVAIAPYGPRSYLLDPVANQIWRHSPQVEAEGYLAIYFLERVFRNVSSGVDLAIDGAIYVAHSNGWVRRYYVGVEDPNFRPDTDLGGPAAVFLPDELDSTLVYVVDGPGRRLLGLDRESGSFRLGFALHVQNADPLVSGAILAGRLYLTDGKSLFITILTPTPTLATDCPALPFPPSAPFDRPELMDLALSLPVSATLPVTFSHYPGGRWPQLGYGVLDGLALTGAPFSDTVRSVAPGAISRILLDPPPLLDTDLGVISTTGRVPAELQDALWGKQVWIDHGNGIETRYGGLAAVLPTLTEGQSVRRLAILGFAGQEPVLLGLWADGRYVGYGRSAPEIVAGYGILFEQE